MGTRKKAAVVKKIRSLVDGEISTYFETHLVVVGEVLVVKFKNIHTFESYVELKVLVEAKENESVNKSIPIIPAAKVDENGLLFVGEDVKESPLDEAGEIEEKMTPEDENQFEPPASNAVKEILLGKDEIRRPQI